MPPIKVYELAKELEIDSISLLAELKKLGITVKNHMSDLADPEIESARTAIGKKTTAGPAKRKKEASEKPVVVRTARPVAIKKKAETPDPQASHEAPAKPKSAKPTVLKRRAKAGEEESVLVERTSERVGDEGPLEYTTEEAAAQAALEESTEASGETTSGTEATGPVVPSGPPRLGSRTIPTLGGSFLRKATLEPKRALLNIISEAPPAPKPGDKAAAGDDKRKKTDDPTRIIKMTKESMDQMAAEEAAKSRGPRERTLKEEDVRFADYRKKEMVFLPKKRKISPGKHVNRTQITTPAAHKRVVEMHDTISVADLAAQMGVKAIDCVRKLIQMGQMATANQVIDFDTAQLLANEFKHEIRNVAFKEGDYIEETQDAPESLVHRPPVVTIMGHVDHGKTTLLDSIREANVAGGEAGGITQHIGAYTIERNGKKVTFIDTPGHEAFTAMRARGANVTDIVILVVAADDGVMPQTREAISHAKAAKVPIIVAVNKIDKPGSNPEKIKQALSELELLSEDWGGDTMFIPVSALKKQGLNELVEAILLNAEVLDLKANPNALASGVVLEAKVEKGRGPVATILVRRGTLELGSPLVAGLSVGRVRGLLDHTGKSIKRVTPGMAAEVQGLESVPQAGDTFNATEDDAQARELASHRSQKSKDQVAAGRTKMSLEELFSKQAGTGAKELKILLRSDVQGSAEAIRESLQKLSTDKVKVEVIFSATGGVTESDVMLASASGAIIIGFNVRPETGARKLAEQEKVEIKSYTIIYELLDEIRNAMIGLLDKKKIEKFLGRAEVRQVFVIPKQGQIAGSSVIDGKILRNASVRLLRDSKVIFEGKLNSLKRFKDDAREVATGFECGIGLENYNDIKTGDIIEAFEIEMISGELS